MACRGVSPHGFPTPVLNALTSVTPDCGWTK
jgi:hypothetical protein